MAGEHSSIISAVSSSYRACDDVDHQKSSRSLEAPDGAWLTCHIQEFCKFNF